MVMQLLHSIKYSVEVPFSNIAQQPSEITKMNSTKKVKCPLKNKILYGKNISINYYFIFEKLNGYDTLLGQVMIYKNIFTFRKFLVIFKIAELSQLITDLRMSKFQPKCLQQ